MKKYAKVEVSEQLLAHLKKDQDKAEGMAKYGRFKTWLHYANLKRWQDQGWHFNYLDSGNELTHICTCGLSVHIDDEPEVSGFDQLKLDLVQSTRGHRNLPSLEGVCVAFIYNFKLMEVEDEYFYTALCQACRSYTELLPGNEADAFVDRHNQACMSARQSKVKE
jgi:hypothetical protein